MTSIRTEIMREIARTTNAIDPGAVEITGDGRYVRLADGSGAWWQPAEALLAILRELPDHAPAPDDGADAGAYADWCRATAKAGVFGGVNGATDTVPTPADFVEPA